MSLCAERTFKKIIPQGIKGKNSAGVHCPDCKLFPEAAFTSKEYDCKKAGKGCQNIERIAYLDHHIGKKPTAKKHQPSFEVLPAYLDQVFYSMHKKPCADG